MDESKPQLSDEIINPFSSGGGGEIFERNVGAYYLVKLLAGNNIGEITGGLIKEIRFQQASNDYPIDDLVIIALLHDSKNS